MLRRTQNCHQPGNDSCRNFHCINSMDNDLSVCATGSTTENMYIYYRYTGKECATFILIYFGGRTGRNCFPSVFGVVCIGFSGNINSLLRAAHTHSPKHSFNNNQIILPNSEITVLRLRHFPPAFSSFFFFFRFAANFPLSTLLRCQVCTTACKNGADDGDDNHFYSLYTFYLLRHSCVRLRLVL